MSDYGMPMSPRPEGTAVETDTTGSGRWNPAGRGQGSYGMVELAGQGGTLVGRVQRTAEGLTVGEAVLNPGTRRFSGPVFVPWTSVLYWVRISKDDRNEI